MDTEKQPTNLEQSRRISRNLKNLFLDPNNYRFADNKDYVPVNENDVLNPKTQLRTRKLIEGTRQENVKDLIASFKANGFLDVDIIQVKELDKNNNYLVLEGNRRVTALKILQEMHESGFDIGNFDPATFRSIPFEIHDNDDKEKHLIVMGLKHISGNKKWSTINQSQLVNDFLHPYKGTTEYSIKEDELCNSLGITKHKLKSMVRVFNLSLAYKSSDYGSEFTSDKYGIFEEVIKRPSIKDWLNWSDLELRPLNKINEERFYSWISSYVNYLAEDEILEPDDEDDRQVGEYEELPPIITKSLEIRELAKFINNENALSVMESSRSLFAGLESSGYSQQPDYIAQLEKVGSTLNSISFYKENFTSDDIERVKSISEGLQQLLPKNKSINIDASNYTLLYNYGVFKKIEEINIVSFKSIKNVTLKNLEKINIFAGGNNSGKTSILESIQILAGGNDFSVYFNCLKMKTKKSSISPLWLNRIMTDEIKIEGLFNGNKSTLAIKKYDDPLVDRKEDYICSYTIESFHNFKSITQTIHTFAQGDMIREAKSISRLCNISMKTPYSFDFEEIKRDHSRTLEAPAIDEINPYEKIMQFIRKIDPSIYDIRFTSDDDFERFIVFSTNFPSGPIDLTSYGEGIQRSFYIALSFSSASNGILCIDELETAIHYSMLIDFTRLIQELSNLFNVQVFITTHSKECIKAFIDNGYENDSISAYNVTKSGGEFSYKYVGGQRLGYLIENWDLDLRGESNE